MGRKPKIDPSNPVCELIAFLGGQTVVAEGIDLPVTTVDSWIRRRAIPAWRKRDLRIYAASCGTDLPRRLAALINPRIAA